MFKLFSLVLFISLSLAQDDKSKDNESVTKLDLSGKNLSSLNDYDFSKYPQLEELDLSNNLINHIRGDKFKKNKQLKKLNLSGNTHLELPKYATLLDANIEELNLSSCGIKEFPQSILDGLTKLKIIDLSNNPLESIKSISFTNLLNLEKIILPDLKDKETITEICSKPDTSQITIEDPQESLQCSDVRNGKWVETPNNDSSINLLNSEAIHKDTDENLTNNNKTQELPEAPEVNDEPLLDDEQASPDGPDKTEEDATSDEQSLNIVSDDQEGVEKVVSKTLNSSPQVGSDIEPKAQDAPDSQSVQTVGNTIPKDTLEIAEPQVPQNGTAVVGTSNNSAVATQPKEVQQPEPTIEKKVEEPSVTIHRSLPAPEPDLVVPQSVPPYPAQEKPIIDDLQNSNSALQEQAKIVNIRATINPNENVPAQQTKQSESEAATGASSSSSGTGTNILIFLVVAVVISGIAAFGYRFYKTRTYRPANTQEPIERELQEIVTDKKSNGPVLDNVLEEEPLMEKIATSAEVKDVNQTKENHSHNANHAKPYIPITTIPLKENA